MTSTADISAKVHALVHGSSTQSQLKEVLARNAGAHLSPSSLRRCIVDSGLVDALKQEYLRGPAPPPSLPVVSACSPDVAIDVLQQPADQDIIADKPNDHAGRLLVRVHATELLGSEYVGVALHALFRGQRALSGCASRSLVHTFAFELSGVEPAIGVPDDVHFVLCAGESGAVATCDVDWRTLAATPGTVHISPMAGVGAVPGPAARLSLSCVQRNVPPITAAAALACRVQRASLLDDGDRALVRYATKWWQEYLDASPVRRLRHVALFVPDENDKKQFICTRCAVLPPGRLLETPRQAAHFVALFPPESAVSLGGGRVGARLPQWPTLHTVLCHGRASPEARAALLCSLLLGFGMNALVCVGTRADESHAWVATVDEHGHTQFWEPETGEQFSHRPIDDIYHDHHDAPPANATYSTVDMVFNDHALYANAQRSSDVQTCHMDVHNTDHWFSFPRDQVVAHVALRTGIPPRLLATTIDQHHAAADLERHLQDLVSQARGARSLGTAWCAMLSQTMAPALAVYELEQCAGVAVKSADFQHIVRRCTPKGHTFKGFPSSFTHLVPARVLFSWTEDPACIPILYAAGSEVVHAVRVKVTAYPDNRLSVWIMLAVTIKSQ